MKSKSPQQCFFAEAVEVGIVAPNIDIATAISGMSASDLLRKLEKLPEVRVKGLFGASANRFNLEVFLRGGPEVVFYYGHGLADRWFGVFGVLLTPENVHLLKDRIAYALACYTGRKLGPLAIEEGAITYIGFTESVYGAFPEPEHNYLKDFIEVWNTVPLLIVKGEKVGVAYEEFRKKSEAYAKLYEEKFRSGEWPNADWYSWAIRWNAEHSVLLGSKSARIGEVPGIKESEALKIGLTMLFPSLVLLAVMACGRRR